MKQDDPKSKLEWIFSKTMVVGECLIWQGAYFKRYEKGKEYWAYPQIYYNKRPWRGNRLVWALMYGRISSKDYICHHCDEPRCLNPNHLYLGNAKTNVIDARNRKRHNSTKKRKRNGQF